MKERKQAQLCKRQLDANFLSSFKGSGPLAGLLTALKQDQSLLLCLRGGLALGYVNIYYKGHNLLKISKTARPNEYRLEFDFNHARYTAAWKQRLQDLQGHGFRLAVGRSDPVFQKVDADGGKSYPANNITRKLRAGDPLSWQSAIAVVKGLIDDFFSPELKFDCFKEAASRPQAGAKTKNLERQHQQQIMAANASLGDRDYFVFDMEYDQQRSSSQEDKSGRFDMLALRKVRLGEYNLVFIELKTTLAACAGECGIAHHQEDIDCYLKDPKFADVRKEDARAICIQLSELLRDKTPEIAVKDIETLFVFSGEAVAYRGACTSRRIDLPGDDFRLNYPG